MIESTNVVVKSGSGVGLIHHLTVRRSAELKRVIGGVMMHAVDPQEIRTLPRKQAHHVNLINPSGHLYMVSKRAFQSIQGRNDQLKQKLKARRDSAEVAAERPPSTLRGSPKNASDESPVAQRAAPCLREVLLQKTSTC